MLIWRWRYDDADYNDADAHDDFADLWRRGRREWVPDLQLDPDGETIAHCLSFAFYYQLQLSLSIATVSCIYHWCYQNSSFPPHPQKSPPHPQSWSPHPESQCGNKIIALIGISGALWHIQNSVLDLSLSLSLSLPLPMSLSFSLSL